MYGDINGDGNMVYVEYTCDNGDLARLAQPVSERDGVRRGDVKAAS